MSADSIVFENVSRFYGRVLGVNRVTLSIPPGITSLVGPNGSGKTTLMNLMTGLIRATRGRIDVLGVSPDDPARLFPLVGYSTQYDFFPRGMTGAGFVRAFLELFGYTRARCDLLVAKAIALARLEDAADRPIASYSKGMRQRIKLAQALAHEPRVLVLDEPLNGLDPLIRAETIALFRRLAAEGRHVIVSSHVLHEVDLISDQVILLSDGYVVAEGRIQDVRGEISDHPMEVLVQCSRPGDLAARLFGQDHIVAVRLQPGTGVRAWTRDASRFYSLLGRLAAEGVDIEGVAPADDNVNSVYEYLIGTEGPTR